MASYTTEQMKKALLGGIDEQGEEQMGLFNYLSAPGQYLRGGVSDALSWLPGGVPAHGFTGRKMWGDEVLQEHGMENKPGLDVTDVLGFGMDLTVDPLNLLAGAGAIKGGLKFARMLPKLASSAKRAETLAQMKAALGAIPGAVKQHAVPLGAGLGAMFGGGALMQSNEEGSDWKDLLGMGMMTAPLVLPIGMAAARKAKGKTGWARQVAEFNAAEDAKIMQRIAEAKTPEEVTRLQGLLSTAGKQAPAAAPAPMQIPQAVTRERFSNPEEFYRVVVGDDAFKDIVESGLVRTKNITKEGASLKDKLGSRPTAFPSFSKGSASLETYGGDANHYVVVTSDASLRPSTAGRHGKGTTHFPTDPQGKHLPSLAGESVDVYRHDGNGMYRLVYSKGKPVTNSPPVIVPTAATALPASTAPRAKYESDFLEQLGFWDANRKSEAFRAVRDAGIADVRAPEAEPILRAMAPPGLAGMDDWATRVQQAMQTSESTRKYISKESLNEARAAMQPAAPAPVSGDDFFDMKALQEYAEPKYKSRETLVHMSPDDFLAMAADLEGRVSQKRAGVKKLIESGTKFNSLPHLGFEHDGKGVAKVVSHEGRHRAMALKELGVKDMPVILRSQAGGGGDAIRWDQQADMKSFDRIRQEWPQALRGEERTTEIPFPVQDPLAKMKAAMKQEKPVSVEDLMKQLGF